MKVLGQIIGGILGIGALMPIIYETRDAGIDYLNSHGFFSRLIGFPGLLALISAILAGGLIGGFKDYTNFHISETVQGETRFNPSWGIFLIALVINVLWLGLLE